MFLDESQLIALWAFVSILALLAYLTYRTPQVVDPSVSLYRLLLAAYPASFRQEYGDAMTQLFRDLAGDAYRRRGLLGLAALWLRTLADFTSSVIRQRREEAARLHEALSICYLVHQWLALMVLSVRYFLHVLLRVRPRTVIFALIFVWAGSFLPNLGIFGLGEYTSLDIYNGVIELRHIYACGEPISMKRWETDRMYKEDRSHLVMPWEFSFSPDHWIGHPWGSICVPCKYWQFRFPVPMLLVLVFLIYRETRCRLRGKNHSEAAIQSA